MIIQKFLKYLLLLLLFIVPAASCIAAGTEQDPLRKIKVVMDDSYPPFIFKESGGRLKGILVDQWGLWEKKTGIKVEITATDWAGAQTRMQAGEFQVIDTIFRNEGRDKLYDFSKPYARLDVPLFFRSNISGISTVDDLKGFAVGVKSGGNIVEMLKTRGITNIVEFKNYEAIVEAARDRKVNVFTVEKQPAYYYLYKFGIAEDFHETQPLYTGEFHRAVRKGDQALLDLVEDGFAKISKAEYEEIERRWYGTPVLGKGNLKNLKIVILVTLGVLSGLIILLTVLKRVIAQKTRALEEEIRVRKEQESLLRESEERFSAITDLSPDIISIIKSDSELLFNSSAVERIHGYGAAEIKGRKMLEMVHPDDREYVSQQLEKLVATPQKTAITQFRFLNKNGSYSWMEAVGCNQLDNPLIQGIISISRNIDERKKVEGVLREQLELLNLAHDAIIVRDFDGVILFWNNGADEMLKYSRQQALGKVSHHLLKTEFPMPLTEINQKLLRDECWEGRLVHTRQDGIRIVVHSRWALQKAENHSSRVLEINTDITEREHSQDELVKIQKLESLGVLAGGIAHDFNNILTAVMGNISFARKLIVENPRATQILVAAEKASQRASELAYQLLTFAKGSKPIKKAVSIKQLLDASVYLVLHGSNVTGVVNIPENLRTIEADEGQISQVFNNIIINATQAMPGGGTITINAENFILDDINLMSLPAGQYVKITFTDTGCGISEEDQKKIFDPYFTTKASGSGLGLASVHSIVGKHGGHISVRSRVGSGTTFYILLPAGGQSVQDTEVKHAPPANAGGGDLYVLVMDDEEFIRTMTFEMLTELGYRAQTCVNGEEALSLYKAAKEAGVPFSAVIMDLTIQGGIGGKEAAKNILEFDPAACLIVSSGYSNDPVMADYEQYGFSAMIVKPYPLNEIAKVLNELLAVD